jgi:hypothetical protein
MNTVVMHLRALLPLGVLGLEVLVYDRNAPNIHKLK